MTDPTHNLPQSLRRELLAAERLETGLTTLLSRLQPPYGAAQRLLAKLQPAFHERELMLDAPGIDAPGMDHAPINFERAVAAMQAEHDQAETDLLAAGLEEEQPDATPEDQPE